MSRLSFLFLLFFFTPSLCVNCLSSSPGYARLTLASLVSWNFTGVLNYGPSPFNPTLVDNRLNTSGLTRGSGVAFQGGQPAAQDAWGGYNFSATSYSMALSSNMFVYFRCVLYFLLLRSISVTSSCRLSYTNISVYTIRHPATGATTGIWQFQVGRTHFICFYFSYVLFFLCFSFLP